MGGNGRILYTASALSNKYSDELLFHEYFHIFQESDGSPMRSINSELEAYLVQYFYLDYKIGAPADWVMYDGFHKLIEELASYIDGNTGYFREGIDKEKFYGIYQHILEELETDPVYRGWLRDDLKGNYPFPNIAQLIKGKI